MVSGRSVEIDMHVDPDCSLTRIMIPRTDNLVQQDEIPEVSHAVLVNSGDHHCSIEVHACDSTRRSFSSRSLTLLIRAEKPPSAREFRE